MMQARNLGAYKLARHVLEKIQTLRVPVRFSIGCSFIFALVFFLNLCSRFRDNVQLACLMVKAKPYHDNEELLTMCYRCSTTNPLLNNRFSSPSSRWINF